jgi:hypothetical protein
MSKKRIFVLGTVLLIGLMFTGCARYYSDYDSLSPYHNLGSGFGYYGYPYYQGDGGGEQYPVLDAHHHHHH